MNTVDLEKYINGFDQDVLRRIKDYKKIVAELSASVDINSMRKEYSSTGTFLEGYYSPSKAELFAGGTKRGKLYKNSKTPNDEFIYYFDSSDKLMALERPMSGLEYFEHTPSAVYGYYIDSITHDMSYFTKTVYSEGKVVEYSRYEVILYFYKSKSEGISFEREFYGYSDGELSSLVFVQGNYTEETDTNKIYSSCLVEGERLRHRSGKADKNEHSSIKKKAGRLKRFLKEHISDCMTIRDCLGIFETMAGIEMVEGDDLYMFDCVFGKTLEIHLVRQFSNGDGEYFQVTLLLEYINEESEKTRLSGFDAEDIRSFVDQLVHSEVYKSILDKKISKIKVVADETI